MQFDRKSSEDPPKYTNKSGYGSLKDAEVHTGSVQSVSPCLDRERIWSVFVSAMVVSLPALLVGCTLAFPSGALLDLTDLEPRKNFKFDSVLSDIFGVSSNMNHSPMR